MASLFDLVQQYLKRDNLPETFKYDRTPPIGTNPPMLPVQPGKPIEKLLPRPGGNEDGFSVYNPDPNRTRNKSNYNERPYKSTVYNDAFPMMGDPMANQATGALNADGLMSYAGDKPLEGIPGAIANYVKNSIPGQLIGNVVGGINNLLPVNRTAILQNELLGAGFQLNDIGQIVGDGGDYDTAGNVMSGYNTSKMTEKTFDDRIASLGNMTPEGRAKRTAAILEAKQNFIDAKNKTTTVFDAKSLAKDPTYKSQQEITKNNNIINLEKEEDEDGEVSYYDPVKNQINSMPSFTGFNAPSTFTLTAPQYGASFGQGYGSGYGGDPVIDAGGTAPGGGYTTDYYGGDPVIDAGGTAPGGGYTTDYYGGDPVIDAGGTAPGGGYATDYYGGGNDTGSSYNAGSGYNATGKGGPAGQGTITNPSNYGTGSGNLGDYQMQPSTPSYTPSPGDGGEGGNNNSGGKIVCTMMNESYGFGSFRNKIWLKHSKGLAPEYQKGYHKIFLPLVKMAKTNKVVRKILEHIAVHRTIDIRQESRGKVHLLGRVYRKILEPLCYFVGKHG